MELCRTTGYTPNAAARQLKRSDSGAIGIIMPDISNTFFCELTRHLEWMIRQKGRNVFISSSFCQRIICGGVMLLIFSLPK